MEPKFQSSFIPKGPINTSTPTVSRPSGGTISIFPILANTIFVLSILAYGGLFAYEKFLDGKIAEDDTALTHEESAFDPAAIQELVVASDQIEAAKGLLHTHVAVSNMFELLQASVLPNVRFISFTFTQNTDGTVQVGVSGEGQSYSAVAEQSDIFLKTPYLKNQKFSSLDVTDKGTISFKFDTAIDQKLVSYSEALKAMDAGQTAPAAGASATTSNFSI